MADRCKSCGIAISLEVFPGAEVECRCGAKVVVGVGGRDPYRSASPVAPPLEVKVDPRALVHAREARWRCPACKEALSAGTRDSRVLGCENCGGFFASHEGLRALLVTDLGGRWEFGGHHADEKALVTSVHYLACPMCEEPMNRTLFAPKSALIVDVCSRHGAWFDCGELQRALDFDAQQASRARSVVKREPIALLEAFLRKAFGE